MQRIATLNKAVDLFGAGKHGFKNGNLAAGVQPTEFDADWCNGMQEELLAIIEAAGLAPDAGTLSQVRQAIDVMLRKQTGAVCVAGGTADALTGAFTPAAAAFTDGMRVTVRAGAANTSTTPTFAADALGAKTIVKGNNLPLVAGDISGAGHWLEMVYDVTLGKWVLGNPSLGVSPQIGAGQSWQTMTGSRALATTYTNSTGKVIWVAVQYVTSAATTAVATVAGVSVPCGGGVTGATQLTAIFPVPPGATYSIPSLNYSSGLYWAEFR